jgi:small subunit ribosomal protein S6
MFILDSNRYARDPSGVSNQIPEMIQQLGGKMLASRLWEERRLAYPINGHKKGTYWLTYFAINSDQISAINRQSQLNEAIIRSLVLWIDPRIADAMVTHALTGGGPKAPAEPTKTAPIEEEVGVDAIAEIGEIEEVEE